MEKGGHLSDVMDFIQDVQDRYRHRNVIPNSLKVAAVYSFAGAAECYTEHSDELKKIIRGINSICITRTKLSKEKTKQNQVLYSPTELNKKFKDAFEDVGEPVKVLCEYSDTYYLEPNSSSSSTRKSSAFREMDFVTPGRVGVEVQFGKYAFMVYNVCAKMTIFHNLDKIDFGVEIVAVKELQSQMSTGVAYFEQFTWDLDHRGPSNIDIPVLVLGITVSND